MKKRQQGPRVAFVGPCGSGKSTIALALRARGIDARMPAQEHSSIPDMWQKLLAPDYLIVLDAPNPVLRARRPRSDLSDTFLDLERRRLKHAIAHADLVLNTDLLTEEAVIERVLTWLAAQGVKVPV